MCVGVRCGACEETIWEFGDSRYSHVRPAVVCVGVRCGNEVGTLMTAGIAM